MTSEFLITGSFIHSHSFRKSCRDFRYSPGIFLGVGELNIRDMKQNILMKLKFWCRLKS